MSSASRMSAAMCAVMGLSHSGYSRAMPRLMTSESSITGVAPQEAQAAIYASLGTVSS